MTRKPKTYWRYVRTVIDFHIDWKVEKYYTEKRPLIVFCNIGELMVRNMGSRKKMIKSILDTGMIWRWPWPWVSKTYRIEITEDTLTLSLIDEETWELTPVNKYVFFEEEVDWEHVWKYTDVIGTCPWIPAGVPWWGDKIFYSQDWIIHYKDWAVYYKDKNWDRHSVYSWDIIPKDAMCKDGMVYRVKQVWGYDYEIIEELWHI